jgi:hypothetical protein
MTSLRITLLGQAMPSATITPTPDPKPTTYRQFSSQSSSQTSAYSCGSKTVYDVCAYNTASTFDGLNCKVGAPPWGTAAVKNGNFVYSPKAGVGCNGTDFYDGANCVFAKADGLNPFVYNNMYYFKPGSRVASMVYAAECPIESTFDGVNCYLGDTPRGKAWVTSADKMIRFPTTAGIICEAGYYFDGSSCIFGRGPDTWTTPWIWNTAGTGVYVAPRNKVCVEEQLGVIRQP